MFTYFFLCVILTACTHVKNIPHGHMLYYISLCIYILLIIRNMYKTLLRIFGKGFYKHCMESRVWEPHTVPLSPSPFHWSWSIELSWLSFASFPPPKPHVIWHLLFFRLQFLLQQASWWLWLYYILFYFFVTKAKNHTQCYDVVYIPVNHCESNYTIRHIIKHSNI